MVSINYLILDFLIILFPLLFSFKWKFKYYKFFKPLAASILIVGGSYILWDILVTARKDWWFNEEYLSGIKIVNLPIEEIMFFIVVPFACIFIYENLVYFVKDKEIKFNKWFYFGLFIVFLIVGLIFYNQDYTILAMFSVALFFLIAAFLYPKILKSRHFWVYLVLSFIPFIIFNYMLTSIPIVEYNPEAIWGGTVEQVWHYRFITIPFEDFFYNFSMLSFYLMAYMYFKSRWIKQKS